MTKQKSMSSNNPPLIIGATVRIKSGKYRNLEGRINEIVRYRHIKLDTMEEEMVDISNITEVVSYDNETENINADADADQPESSDNLVKKYTGAVVKVKVKVAAIADNVQNDDDSNGDDADADVEKEFVEEVVEGRILKVIAGEWCVTNNPKITTALRAEKFEVVKYANNNSSSPSSNGSDVVAAITGADLGAGKRNHDGDGDVDNGRNEENKRKRRKSMGMEENNEFTTSVTHSEEEEEVVDANNDNKGEGEISHASNNGDDDHETNDDGNGSAKETMVKSSNASHKNTNVKEEKPKDLMGATVIVNQGRHKNLRGIITEKKTSQRLQVDNNTISSSVSITRPLDFWEVEIVQYPLVGGEPQTKRQPMDFFSEDAYANYVGAKIRVVVGEYKGLECNVIRTILVGEWYITDNPDIDVALTSNKFDVIEYAADDNDDDEDATNEEDNNQINDDDEGEMDEDDDWSGGYESDSILEDDSATGEGYTEEEAQLRRRPQPPSLLDAIFNKRKVSMSVPPANNNCNNNQCVDACCAIDENYFDTIDDASWDESDIDIGNNNNNEIMNSNNRSSQQRKQPPPSSLLDAIYNKSTVSMSVPSNQCADECCAADVDDLLFDDNLSDFSWEGSNNDSNNDEIMESNNSGDDDENLPTIDKDEVFYRPTSKPKQTPSFLDAIYNKKNVSMSVPSNNQCADGCCAPDVQSIFDNLDDASWEDDSNNAEEGDDNSPMDKDQVFRQPRQTQQQTMSLLDAIFNKSTVSMRVPADQCADGCCADVGDYNDDDYSDNGASWGNSYVNEADSNIKEDSPIRGDVK